jgi:peptide methionine sulfoxide reductase MsrB
MGQKMSSHSNNKSYPSPAVMGNESIMSAKSHGTSHVPVQKNLRWSVDRDVADRICNFNRHYAEHSGYFKEVDEFMKETKDTAKSHAITYYDSNTGKPLFTAPRGRTMEEFLRESRAHGWPSFRDDEVNWEYVRVLPNGETVSVDGTHLGHNLPDSKGSRYCINLVCVAGRPTEECTS